MPSRLGYGLYMKNVCLKNIFVVCSILRHNNIIMMRLFGSNVYLYMFHCLRCQVVVHSQENSHTFQRHCYQKKNNFQKKCMDKKLDFQLYHLSLKFISCYTQVPVHDIIRLPMQVFPSPRNPLLQVHSKLPSVFAQFAFMSQSCNPFLHSSSSIDSDYNCTLNFWHRYNIKIYSIILYSAPT